MILNELFKIPLMERFDDRIEALDQWRDDPTIYVSFTDLPKVGINPTSEFDTPLGIYAYPLKEMFKYFEDNEIPFAGEREYIQVLQSDQVTELSQYSEADLDRDIAKLKERFGQDPRILKTANNDLHRYLHQNSDHSNMNFPSMGEWSKQDGNTWTERTTWAEREASVDTLIQKMNKTGETFDFIIWHNWRVEAKPRTPAGVMWNITRNVAINIEKPAASMARSKMKPMAKPSIIAWNSILRWLGYQALSDKKGTGLIHSNEPISAVFLTTKAFRHIKTIHNKTKQEEPVRFARLAYMMSVLNAKGKGKTIAQKAGGGFYNPTDKTVALILQEWPDLLDSQGKHIKWVGSDFHATITQDFPGFMRAILKVDFDRQFPIVMKVLERRDYFDSVDVVDGVLSLFDTSGTSYIMPARKNMKTFLKVMLDDWNVIDLARAIERLKGADEKESEKLAARFVVNFLLNGLRCKTTEVEKILDNMHSAAGVTYWDRLLRLCPKDELFDKNEMHDDWIEMARNPLKHFK